MLDLLFLFAAGMIGGLLNAIAGGGTFVTFPALVATGVPLVAANATSTVAAMPGYLAATIGFRRDLARLDRGQILRLTLWAMLGGAAGSVLLMLSSNKAFGLLVPFLLLAATIAFIWGAEIREWAARHRGNVAPFGAGSMIAVAIYGGYFNGGLGIVLLALFALWGMHDLHAMNGLKSWISFALAVVSLIIFAGAGQIHWPAALAMAGGTITGGLAGAPVARRIPVKLLRALIAVIGFGTAAVFFWRLF